MEIVKHNIVENIISNIDNKDLLTILKPIIIIYISAKTIQFIANNYKIQKDYTLTNMTLVNKRPEFNHKFSDDYKAELLKVQFGKHVLDFLNTLEQEIPNIDLSLLYKHLSNFKIIYKNFKLENFFFKRGIIAKYNILTNCIEIDKNDFNNVIVHELFHMASSFYCQDDNIVYSGFSQFSKKTKKDIGNGINEGYTQLLSERYFANNTNIEKSYSLQVHYVQKLENIVGNKLMEKMYLQADLLGLIEELKIYENIENIMNFISAMDFIEKYLTNKNNIYIKKSMISEKLTIINQFLISCYVQKIKRELDNQVISVKEFNELFYNYLKELGTSIYVDGNKYTYLDVEKIKNVLVKTLSNDLKLTISSKNK